MREPSDVARKCEDWEIAREIGGQSWVCVPRLYRLSAALLSIFLLLDECGRAECSLLMQIRNRKTKTVLLLEEWKWKIFVAEANRPARVHICCVQKMGWSRCEKAARLAAGASGNEGG